MRNALEHLDDADLDDETAYATAGTVRSNRSLRALPGSRLLIGTSGPLMFELVDPADIEQRATTIVAAIEQAEDDDVEAWIAEHGLPYDDPEPEDT